jgi:NAD(P)-dependent dehydrogenase (short-subunit alcohol dehydrogenase family)
MRELSGKVAFITGGASGIGFGIAQVFAEQGVKIAIADIDPTTLESAVEKLRATGATAIGVQLDVTDRSGWEAAVKQVTAELGQVQLLFNNAGVSTLGLRFEEVPPEMWDRVIAINLTGVYNGMHYFLDGIRQAGGGHIINTASMGGLFGVPTLSPYSASKAAVIMLSEAVRAELADENVGVSVLAPGGVRSNLWRTSRAVRGLPDTDVAPTDASGQSSNDLAMDPYIVGQYVLRAVLENELYVITHPEMAPAVAARGDALLAAFDSAAQHPIVNL